MKCCPKLRIRLAVGMSLLGASFAFGDEYTLEPGETDSISGVTNEYESASIAGTLSVSGGAYFNVRDISFSGSAVSVSGTGTRFGAAYVNKGAQGTVTIAPGSNGEYPTFSVSDGAVSELDKITVLAPAEPLASETVVDLATVDSATYQMYSVVNNTSCTNRYLFKKSGTANPSLSVSGIERVTYGGSRFSGAPFLLEADAGVDTVVFRMGGGMGRNYYYNAAETEVIFRGACDLVILKQEKEEDANSVGLRFRSGAFFENEGDIFLACSSKAYIGTYFIDGDIALGPSVSCLTSDGGYSPGGTVGLTVSEGKTLTVNNLDFSRSGYLRGSGTVAVNATAAVRTFKGGRIMADSTLTVAKFGANPATVTGFAWLPSVDVREGDLVFASDTVISNTVTIAEGARLVADGCTVTLFLDDEASADMLARCAQVNGGRVVVRAADRTMAYAWPVANIPSVLDIVGGNVIYSGLGIDRKFWRFTYTKMSGDNQSIAIGRQWMFGADGERACKDLTGSSSSAVTELTKSDASDMAKASARVRVHSSATVTTTGDYGGLNRLYRQFQTAFKSNNNHVPNLTSPVIDPDDEKTWVTLELRLADTAKPITGYNFATGPNKNKYATDWLVYASSDGKVWELVDQRANVSHAGTDYTFYGDTSRFDSIAGYVQPKECFRFSGYRSDNLTPSENPLAVRLDKGATLDLRAFVPAGGQEVNALTVDVAQEVAGVLYGAKLSQTGNVNVIAPTRAAAKGQLPIRLVDLVGDQRLDGWTVSVNGVPTQKTLKLEDDGTVSIVSQGLLLIFR